MSPVDKTRFIVAARKQLIDAGRELRYDVKQTGIPAARTTAQQV